MKNRRQELLAAIEGHTALVGVVGLGYVGLPLVRAIIAAGFRTLGFDTDPHKVEQLARGESYIKHVPSEWIASCRKEGKFEPTADMSRLGEADILLICVPTPLAENRQPDLSYVKATSRQIAATLRPGQLIVLESTIYPGATRQVLLPQLAATGKEPGQDFFLAYSPEREDPGNPQYTASNVPKVVGGFDEASLQLANAFYSRVVVQTVPVSSLEVAEACKILENTYRAVNIALVNELKVLFSRMDIDIWEVIEAARTKPFGFQAFYPGPGLGGHCIPIDPFYLSWVARQHGMATQFIELAGEVNTRMPQFVIDRTREALQHDGLSLAGSRICVIGAAYKKDVDDPRESPAFRLIELLIEQGAIVTYNDPHIPRLPAMRSFRVPPLESQPLTPEFLTEQDCVLICTDHSAYDWDYLVQHARRVVDTRNATRNVSQGREKIWKA